MQNVIRYCFPHSLGIDHVWNKKGILYNSLCIMWSICWISFSVNSLCRSTLLLYANGIDYYSLRKVRPMYARLSAAKASSWNHQRCPKW